MGDEEIVVAVAVEVAGVDAHAASACAVGVDRAAREQRFVGEGAVAAVEPEEVGLHVVGDEEVGVAVAVEVAGDDAQRRPAAVGEPAARRDVLEGAVAAVAVEAIGHGRVGSTGPQ